MKIYVMCDRCGTYGWAEVREEGCFCVAHGDRIAPDLVIHALMKKIVEVENARASY